MINAKEINTFYGFAKPKISSAIQAVAEKSDDEEVAYILSGTYWLR